MLFYRDCVIFFLVCFCGNYVLTKKGKLILSIFDIFLSQGRLVGLIRAGGGCVRVGKLSKLPLKGDGIEKRGWETTFLKKGASWVKEWEP